MNPPDKLTPLLLICVLAFLLLPALTSVGGIGLVSVWMLSAFFGSTNLSIWATGAAIIVHILAWPDGDGWTVWRTLLVHYRSALSEPNAMPSFWAIWLDPPVHRSEYWALIVAGTAVGAIAMLIRKDALNRDEALLSGSASSPWRTPTALICAWLVAILPNRFRHYTIIGTEYYRGWPVILTDRDCTKHLLAAGTTGAGKTEFSLGIIESAIRTGHPIICLDGKGDMSIAERIRAFAESHGRKFFLFNGVNPIHSDVYNPLSTGSYTSKSDRIIAIRGFWSEPHYETLAVGFMQTVFSVLDHQTLNVDLSNLSEYMSTKALLGLLRRKGYSSPDKRRLAAEIASQREAERTAISSLKSEITNIANSSLGQLFDTRKAAQAGRTVFTLAQARAEGAIVYFALPGLLYPKTASSIARLVLNDCKAIANVSTAPLFITLEERSVYPGPQSNHLLSLGRTHQLQLLNLCQTLSDLRVGSPDLGEAAAEQTFASTNTFVFFQLNTADDAETASRLIGTTIEKQFTAQTQAGTPTGMSSSRKVYEFKFHPDRLKFQRVGQAIVLDKNRGTVRKVAIRKSKI